MTLTERLRSWAQNEEMIDQHFTAHGRDCNEAADRLEQLEEELATTYAEMRKIRPGLRAIFDRSVWDRVDSGRFS